MQLAIDDAQDERALEGLCLLLLPVKLLADGDVVETERGAFKHNGVSYVMSFFPVAYYYIGVTHLSILSYRSDISLQHRTRVVCKLPLRGS